MPSRNDREKGLSPWIVALAAVGLAALLTLAPATAAENGVDLQQTRITSDKVVYSGGEDTIVFKGNVRVQRSDFDLWCRRMTVHLTGRGLDRGQRRQETGQAADFEKIVAEQDVRFRMEGRNATCRKAVYSAGAEVITLLGDVRLQQGRNRIRGQEVRMDLASNTTEIVGSGTDQVEATFYTENSTGPSNGGSQGN